MMNYLDWQLEAYGYLDEEDKIYATVDPVDSAEIVASGIFSTRSTSVKIIRQRNCSKKSKTQC
jgi:hypothetical protein